MGILLTFALSCGCVAPPVAHPEPAVWSEFLAPHEVRGQLPVLAEFGAALYLALRLEDLADEHWSLLADARTAGVPVRAWLQITSAGIWINEGNIAEFRAYAHALLDEAAVRNMPVDWIILDLEPPLATAEALRDAAFSGDFARLIAMLADEHNPAQFRASTAAMRELVQSVQARGTRVMAVTLPWTIDDLDDGDPDIQDAFNTPFAGIPWDEISVILYRPTLAQLFGGVTLDASVIRRYGGTLRGTSPAGFEVALGNIHEPGLLVAPGYESPMELATDIAAARAAGAARISLFSLDGMVASGDVRAWLETTEAEATPAYDLFTTTDAVRAVVLTLDRLVPPSR